jgi:alpha-tubulin suppressor-like RCC1 family protein
MFTVRRVLSVLVIFSVLFIVPLQVQAESGEAPASNSAGQSAAGRISVGGGFACVVMSGSVYCWGENDGGQLGVVDGTNKSTAVKIAGISTAVSVAAGDDHACALLASGRVSCWGSNAEYQLGNVDTSLNGPAEVGQLSDASAITSGTGFSCALSTSNGAVCWGASLKGQLGVTISNTGGRRHIPQLVDGLRSDVVSIAAGVSHACAVKTDGNVWCWGTATQGSLVGYLGNVVSTFSELPVRVRIESGGAPDYVTDAVAVSAGSGNSCVLRSTSGIYCWGTNSYGKMGNSTTGSLDNTNVGTGGGTPWALPVLAVAGQGAAAFSGAVSVSLGDEHSCALVTGATVKCWGQSLDGRVGNNTVTPNLNYPVSVSNITNVAAVSAGANSTCALTTSDTVYCWGKGTSGQIGNGALLSATTPRLVSAAASPGVSFAAINGRSMTSAPFTVSATVASGATPTFSSSTTSICTVSGSTVTVLAPGTCTIVAEVSSAGFYAAGSASQSFTVESALPPTVSTSSATSLAATSAVLNAMVNPNGADATVSFLVGTSATLEGATTVESKILTGSTSTEVSQKTGVLLEATTYYFQVVAKNIHGTSKGEIRSFTTGRPIGVSINDAAEFTNKKAVTVSVTGPAGSVKAILSNDGGFKSSETFDLVDASAEIKWTLVSSRDERLPKIVYVKYVSRFGTTSSTASTDDIILDTTAPVLSTATAVAAAAPETAVSVASVRSAKKNGARITVKASDANSGIGSVEMRTSARKKATSVKYANPKAKSQTLTVNTKAKTLQVRVIDRAGNPSPWKTVRVK